MGSGYSPEISRGFLLLGTDILRRDPLFIGMRATHTRSCWRIRFYMDRMWTKRVGKKKARPQKRRLKGEISFSAVRLRLFAAAAVILSILGLTLLSSGSSNRRLMMMSVPMVYAAEPEAPQTPEPAISISRVEIMPDVGEEMRIEVLSPKAQPSIELGGPEPRILIYHTHTTEAYAGTEDSDWRTHDQSKNIVAVGELLTKILREEYGCNVIYDKTDHEPPKLGTAYSRSEVTMKKYKQMYPSLTIFIDVHRDAGKGLVTEINGKRVARLMFVVGTGEGATGTGYKEMPDFESNYALALAVTNKLAEIDEDLPRDIRVKVGRYNQHVSNQCLLLEVGDNENTLEEVLNAVPYFAQALMEVAGNGSPNADPAKAASAAANAVGKKNTAAPTPTPKINWAP